MLSRLFRRRPSATHTVVIEPAGTSLPVSDRTRLLDAALDQGLDFPHSCRVGGCGTCKCRVVSGQVKEHSDTSYLLSADELKRGFILACQSTPLSDLVVEVSGLGGRASKPSAVSREGKVSAVDRLSDDALRLTLELDGPLDYLAGQYAALTVEAVGTRSYSFSRAPSRRASEREVSFDIRVLPEGRFSGWLADEARCGDRVHLEGPRGGFYLRTSGAPIVAVAAGVGLGPIFALLESLEADAIARDVTVLVGARDRASLYGIAELEALQSRFPARLDLWPVLSAEPIESPWPGRRGRVTDLLSQLPRPEVHHAYLCGPPAMVESTRDTLSALGVSQIFSDAFLDTSRGSFSSS